MDTEKVIHDREGQMLTVWFGKPSSEVSSTDNEHGVVVMKRSGGCSYRRRSLGLYGASDVDRPGSAGGADSFPVIT